MAFHLIKILYERNDWDRAQDWDRNRDKEDDLINNNNG